MTLSSQRYVVTSLGSIGRRHLENLRKLRPQAQIAALRRPTSDALSAEGYDVELTSLSDALDYRPSAAIIAGPAPSHVPLARAFVEHGIAVLVEKPLSHTLEGLTALAAVARRTRTPVMVGYNLRFSPSLAEVRNAVLNNEIGSVLAARAEVGQYLPSWRPESDYRNNVSAQSKLGGGALLELSHEIDYIYWIFGMPARVTCRGGRLSDLEIDVEDCCELILEYDAPRRLISIHLDFLQRVPARSCKLVGTSGTLHWYALEERYVLETPDQPAQARTVHLQSGDRNQTYRDELAAFIAAADTGGKVPISLDEGIDVMRVIQAARRSMASGRAESPVQLELDG